MARLARIALVNIPYHVTQRGNARQYILSSDEERSVYLDLLRKNIRLHDLLLLGYCLMSNHVHLLLIPHKPDSLAQAMKQTHGRYATYWNATHGSSGHVWQGRFYSCPMDQSHLWVALRYVERNPLRAGLVESACAWKWSSASVHCGETDDEDIDLQLWQRQWSTSTWQEYLSGAEPQQEIDALRQCTHTGRPLGDDGFLKLLEERAERKLGPRKGGRTADARSTQPLLNFDNIPNAG